MVIWIDAKNSSLYKGGISSWLNSIISRLDHVKTSNIRIVMPKLEIPESLNPYAFENLYLPWFDKLPRKINHIIYDSITFRFFAWLKNPQIVFSPYYDVIMPKKVFSIISIHDLCFLEVPELYPYLQRKYYVRAMKTNLSRASLIVTVSQNSKNQMANLLNVPSSKVIVIKNRISEEFVNYKVSSEDISEFRSNFESDSKLLLYSGGFENRKNIDNLFLALENLILSGVKCTLIVTGEVAHKWKKQIERSAIVKSSVKLLGFISNSNLKIAYKSVDVVVYPSRSEGFGRSCIEAMYTNTPLACSDIPVFREVAAGYPKYFNPLDPLDISEKIKLSMNQNCDGSQVLNKYLNEPDGFLALQEILQDD